MNDAKIVQNYIKQLEEVIAARNAEVEALKVKCSEVKSDLAQIKLARDKAAGVNPVCEDCQSPLARF